MASIPTLRRRRVCASAPGKAILFGEHAVVYGKTAVAVAVSDLRIQAELAMREDGHLVIELPDLVDTEGRAVCYSTPLEALRVRSRGLLLLPAAAAHSRLTEATIPGEELTSWLSELFQSYVQEGRKALMAITFLFLGILGDSDVACGVTITVRKGSLPIGAGLGSSAALSVACAAAMCRLWQCQEQTEEVGEDSEDPNLMPGEPRSAQGLPSGVSDSGSPPPSEVAKLINEWAYAAEVLLHGNPSGLDNTVSCFGGAIKYSKRASKAKVMEGPEGAAGSATCSGLPAAAEGRISEALRGFSALEGFPGLRVLLTNTRVPRETRVLVAGVAERLQQDPCGTGRILDAIGSVTEDFLSRIYSSAHGGHDEWGVPGDAEVSAYSARGLAAPDDHNSSSQESLQQYIGCLMRDNHRLLGQLGVSHPSLEKVCDAAEASGGFATKLTGAGGGGCLITLLDVNRPLETCQAECGGRVAKLVETLAAEGFDCYETTLGGCGVMWHDL